MSSAPVEIQRLALVGYRSDVETFIARTQGVRTYVARLTTATTAIATLSAMLEQIDELSSDDGGPPRRSMRAAGPPRPAEIAADSRSQRTRSPRSTKPKPKPKPSSKPRAPAGAAVPGGKTSAWALARDTLTLLSMSMEGLDLKEAQRQMSTGNELLPIDTVRWRLDAVVRRHQAALIRKKPRTYKLTDLGKQALKEDRDIRI